MRRKGRSSEPARRPAARCRSRTVRWCLALLAPAAVAAGCRDDASAADDGGADVRPDVPADVDAVLPPTADPRPRLFVPPVVPDEPGGRIADHKQRMVVFWFGRVDRRNNHAQCRAGFSDEYLLLQCAVFDRQIYDEAPTPAAIPEWDAWAWSFDLDGDPAKSELDERSFRIVAQAGRHGTAQTALLRGDGGSWTESGLPLGDDIVATPDRICIARGYRGEGRDESRGWHVDAFVPWSVVGLAGPPTGTAAIWNVALTVFDRDDLAGSLRGEPQHWPGAGYDPVAPSTWAAWEFLGAPFLGRVESGAVAGTGRPAYAVAHAARPFVRGTETTVAIRQGLEGDAVENAAVGASDRLCSGDDDYNFGDGAESFGGNTGREYFHVQNQEDYADWPCFARLYVKFPLARVPAGKALVSATLRLHHAMPTSGGDQGNWSLVQAFAVAPFLRDGVTPWTAANLSWNDGPLAVENCAGFWGDRTGMMENGWDALPAWHWDVGRAVARALDDGASHAAFVLYSADSEYHTGKQFVRSEDFADWGDPAQRPTLELVLADPTP